MITPIFWIIPVASILALVFAWFFFRQMMKESEGTELMAKIARHVRKGAMSYLKQQYKVVASVFLALVVLFSIMAYGFGVQNEWVPIAFLTGGFFSGLAGFLGMKTATYASARTANAARSSLNSGLQVAFRSGAVMGLVVVGLGLLDISFWYILLNICIPAETMDATHKLTIITTTMLTFGMGASTQALFARVGGGIYKQPMSEPTWSAKSKPASPKTTRATRQPLPTMWETTSEMWPAWGRICTNHIAVPFWQPPHWVLPHSWRPAT